eukprot:CAMPEP_0115016722 /NCGR_PEP_ID=MMETSP0216-20121206/27637_1 /TAXON_ID=223996 /ORGANISM="Protocruzia adherens, Strain Boccale" /LENGTH=483 /DNA_ID=CAMNT_0002387295 /DNA_START=204 /DNA_END=1655 /DNA_ORIENTATION=+
MLVKTKSLFDTNPHDFNEVQKSKAFRMRHALSIEISNFDHEELLPHRITPKNIGTFDSSISISEEYHGVCLKKGSFRRTMEDTHLINRNMKLQELSDLFALFDGHSGTEAAAYARDNLSSFLDHSFHQCDSISDTLTNAFERLDEDMREEISRDSGSTAAVVLVSEGSMTFANLGDTRALLLSDNKVKFATQDHHCGLEPERKAIEEKGGVVIKVGRKDRVQGSLELSRCFGNFKLKEYLSETPDVSTVSHSENDDFIVLATDGVFKVMTNEDVAAMVTDNRDRLSVGELAEMIVDEAYRRGTTDNTSAVVVDLQKYRTCQSNNSEVSTADDFKVNTSELSPISLQAPLSCRNPKNVPQLFTFDLVSRTDSDDRMDVVEACHKVPKNKGAAFTFDCLVDEVSNAEGSPKEEEEKLVSFGKRSIVSSPSDREFRAPKVPQSCKNSTSTKFDFGFVPKAKKFIKKGKSQTIGKTSRTLIESSKSV